MNFTKTFEEIIERKDERNSIYCVDVSEYRCMEIDTVEDYHRAQKELKRI